MPMDIHTRLRTRLQALSDGEATVEEVEAWIGENFISVPEVEIREVEIEPVDVDVPDVPEDLGEVES